MNEECESGGLVRFGAFEVDLQAGELRRHGRSIRLQEQPFQILTLLLARPGQILRREEIKEKLWPPGTFVDFDHSIATAVKKLRIALGDDANSPHYVETVPRYGYRLIVPVDRNGGAPDPRGLVSSHDQPREAGAASSFSAAPAVIQDEPARSRLWTVAIALGLVVVTAFPVWFFTSPDPAPKVHRTAPLTQSGRVALLAQPVTDGSRLFFVQMTDGHYRLAQVSIGGAEPVPMPTPFPDARVYDISPDHSQLLVGRIVAGEDETPLWIVPISGGSPRRPGDRSASGAAWSPNGRRIVCTRGSSLYLLDDEWAEHKIATLPGRVWGPRWSPDGRVLRFTLDDPVLTTLSLWEVSVEGKNLHRLLTGWGTAPNQWGDGESSGDWTPDGKYFIFQSVRGDTNSIWAVQEKQDIVWRPSRKPLLLTTSDLRIRNVSLGGNGRRVLFTGSKDGLELARYDHKLNQFVPYLSGIPVRHISFSGDGQWVAYVTAQGFLLWRSRLDGSDRLQLTFPPLGVGDPQWSPDSRRIAFSGSQPGKPPSIFLISPDGGTPQPAIAEDSDRALRPDWSPLGDWLLFTKVSPDRSARGEHSGIYRFDLGSKKESLFPGAEGLREPARSPDGRFVAALDGDFKRLMLFDSKSRRWTELTSGRWLFGLAWSRDNKFVYSQELSGDSEQPIFRVRISDRRMERIATSKQILRSDVTAYRFIGLAPDGSPLAALIRNNTNVYSLDVDFP